MPSKKPTLAGITALIFSVILNMIFYYRQKAQIEPYYVSLSAMARLVKAGARVSSRTAPGIETYLDLKDKSGQTPYPDNFVEELAIEIEYKDRDNITRSVVMPVIMSALVQHKVSGDKVYCAGIAQRGDTVAFTGYLPGYVSLLTTKLYVGSTARKRLEESGGFKVKTAGKESELDGESITLSGISMYKGTCRISNTEKGKDMVTGDELESRTTAYSFSSENPEMYYIPSGEGRKLASGSKESISLKTYKAGDPMITKVERTGFLIRLVTDSKNTKSGTTGDVSVRLKYIDTSDNTVFSKSFSAKDATKDYMGYWPSKNGVKGDFAYLYGSKPGGCIEFYADIKDLVMLLSVVVETPANNTDEYQLGGLSVLSVTDVGKRRIYKQDTTGEGDTSSYRIVRSSTNIAVSPFPITFNSAQLFTAGTNYDYTVGGRSGDTSVGIPSSTPDYDTVRYSMSYDQTKLDYGFSRAVKTFDVNVRVADDSDVSNSNGDSGSANKFYFQLLFQNGKSGYVQANQQLTADSFRAGFQEMFSMSLNRDYGALTGISIIPEDLEDDEITYDKLNIENITVTEKSEGGSSIQYVFDDVGWIGIDYHDIAEASSIKGRDGRTASDMASVFDVSYQRHVVNLLCEITTLPGTIEDDLAQSASVSCDLEYIDNNNDPQTISFDMISRMADYMKKTPITYEAPTDGSLANYYTNMATVSDPEWMLRPNHTDRFIMPAIPNLKSVKNLTIYALNRNKGTTHWNIGGICISEILKDGKLSLTAEDEYYRNMSTAQLCTMVKDDKVSEFTLPMGVSQSLKFYMTDNQLAWSTNTSWATPVTRLPDSTNDTVNVFLYPSASNTNLDKDKNGRDVSVSLALQYMERFSQVKQVTVSSLKKYGSGTENAMFYATGLSAPGMERLVSLSLRSYSSMGFDRALVQHIRQGVVVANYTVSFMGASADLGITAKPNTTVTITDPTCQRFLMELTADTVPATLFAEQNDIAVAFRYKMSIGNSTREYYSPYVYLTDVGISSIRPGMMIDIPFEVPYVAEVTGYRVASFGQIDAGIRGAMLINNTYTEKEYDYATDAMKYVGLATRDIYSFDVIRKIENAVHQVKDPAKYSSDDKDGNLTLLDLNFTTAEASNIFESGTSDPVEMIFNYKDYGKRDQMRVIPDIRTYIQSDEGSFVTGESAHIMLFLPECSELTSIFVLPLGENEGASLSIASIAGSTYPVNQQLTRLVDQVFTNVGGGTINLKEVRLKTTVRDYGTGEAVESVVANHLYSTLLEGGQKIELIPDIYVGEKGFTSTASLLVNGVETDVTRKYIVRNEGVVTFTAPKNNTTSPQTYSIVIASSADPNVYDTIIVTVPVPYTGNVDTVVETITNEGTTDTGANTMDTGTSTTDTGSSGTADKGTAVTSEPADTEDSSLRFE